MPCICQYFVTAENKDILKEQRFLPTDMYIGTEKISNKELRNEKIDLSSTSLEVSASELVAAKAEIWVLKKNLSEAKISVENLEILVHTIIAKQNDLLSDMYALKRQNIKLNDECRMQRDYQTMERNAMMRELHGIKCLLGDRTKILDETVQNNSELTNSLQDANEKIYMMGMKFLKMKSHSKYSSAHSSTACSEKSY